MICLQSLFMHVWSLLTYIFVPSSVVKSKACQSSAVKQALKRKNVCHRVHKEQQSESSLENFKAASEVVNRLIVAERMEFESSLVAEPDVRKFFSYVNSKLGSSHLSLS